MKKSTKGAIAASAAAVLLLGGAGSLAYWTDTVDLPGGSIESGHMRLTDPDCGTGFSFDGGDAYEAGDTIVPGDTLTKTCTFAVEAEGNHLTADFDVTDAEFAAANALTDELAVDATYEVNGAPVTGADTPIANGDDVEATIVVTFDGPGGTNASQDLTATLNAITVTATQGHSAA